MQHGKLLPSLKLKACRSPSFARAPPTYPQTSKCSTNVAATHSLYVFWRGLNRLSFTGWHIRLWRTSSWHQNKSSLLAWLGQNMPGQNGTFVLKSTGGSSQPDVSPCISLARIVSVLQQVRSGADSRVRNKRIVGKTSLFLPFCTIFLILLSLVGRKLIFRRTHLGHKCSGWCTTWSWRLTAVIKGKKHSSSYSCVTHNMLNDYNMLPTSITVLTSYLDAVCQRIFLSSSLFLSLFRRYSTPACSRASTRRPSAAPCAPGSRRSRSVRYPSVNCHHFG